MPPPRERPKAGSPEDWMIHAQSDRTLAHVAHGRPDVLPEQVCFHAQQAVEKALKAVLTFSRIEFPLVHDIETLLEVAEQGGITVPPDVAEAGALTPFAVAARYPGSGDEVTSVDVEEAIRLAEAVVRWAVTILQGGTGRKGA